MKEEKRATDYTVVFCFFYQIRDIPKEKLHRNWEISKIFAIQFNQKLIEHRENR